jgi:hypothetical protein
MCGSVPLNSILANRRAVRTQFPGRASGALSSGNIAEGNISLGSLSELPYTLWLAKDLAILSEDEWSTYFPLSLPSRLSRPFAP